LTKKPQNKTSPPPGWGNDELSRFIDLTHYEQLAIFATKKPQYAIIKTIDDCYKKIADNLINTKDITAANFLYRSHSAYRGGAVLALATQVNECFPLMRVCVECAGYALHIFDNKEVEDEDENLEKIWENRHRDKESLNNCRNCFNHSKIIQTVKAKDKKLAEVYNFIYQRAIDFGSHPNEMAVFGSMSIEKVESGVFFKHYYLHGDSLNTDHALISLARAGLCSLFVFQHIFKARFEILGLKPVLQGLKKYL